jgi:signal transduction histidine kinase
VGRPEPGGHSVSRRVLAGFGAAAALAALMVGIGFDSAGTADTADAVAAGFAFGSVAVVGVIVTVVVPDNRIGWLLVAGVVVAGVGSGLTEAGVHGIVTDPGAVPGARWFAALGPPLRGVGWLTLVVAVPALFPTGRLPGPRWRWLGFLVACAIVLPAVSSLLSDDAGENRLDGRFTSPLAASAPWADLLAPVAVACVVAAIIGSVAGLVSRWRRGGAEVRQQVILLAVAACLPAVLLPLAVFAPGVPSWMFALVVLPLPIAIAVAVLTRGLYDLRRAASRGTVWLLMTALVVLSYSAVVVAAAAFAADRRSWWPPAVAAAAASLLVMLVRDRLQRGVNRVIFGRALEPYEVLTQLGARLDGVADPRRVVADTAARIAAELDLAEVAVREPDGSLIAGDSRSASGPGTVIVLRAFGRPVGTLSFRADRELSVRELQLISDLARHLGSALHALALREEVQHARERLVLAREEERRRLRRDLHDGIGPTLAGLMLKTRTAATLLPEGADRAAAQLGEIGEEIRRTVTDVRRVVEGLRPPALDELGLVAACSQALQSLVRDSALTLVVEDEAQLPALPAAVEVAAYRIVLEAVTNVVRHSSARTCRVRFGCDTGTLSVEIADDGSGFADPPQRGTGLDSMRERAQELGGELTASSASGVTVRARIPVPGFA